MYDNHTLLTVAEIKILEVFLDFQKHYFAELVKITKLTRPRTLRVLRKLVRQNILYVTSEANVKYYFLQKSSVVYATLSIIEYNKAALFLDKHKIIKRALGIIKEKYADYLALFVFGSTVKGYATKFSDVDLLLIKENFSASDIKKVDDVVDLINGRTGLKISPHFMKIEEFKKKNALAKEVIEKHILFDGGELFFRMVLE